MGNTNQVLGVGSVISPWSNCSTHKWDAPQNKFVPTTVGIEVVSFNSTNSTYILNLRVSNPEQLSPSKPQNLSVQKVNNVPQLTWSQMQEPDVLLGGSVKIYRKTDNGSYILVATVAGNSTSWTEGSLWGNGNRIASYKIQAIDSQQKSSVFSDVVSTNFSQYMDKKQPPILSIPNEYSLNPNFPNPFNPSTTIRYQIPNDENVAIKVYDLLGSEVSTLAAGFRTAGYYEVNFDGTSLSSGIYIYRMTAGKYNEIRKMLLMK